jgi:two-component system, response regulator
MARLNRTGLRILLAEDDDLDALNTERFLRRFPEVVDVSRVRDGQEALEWLGREPELGRLVLLSDLRMPRMSGLELLEALRSDARTAGLPVVVLSSSSNTSDIAEAFRWNAAGYMVKPLEQAEFADSIRMFVEYWNTSLMPQSGLG